MKQLAITTIVAGGLVAGILGTAGTAQADYGQPNVSGVATYQGTVRSVDYDPRYDDRRYDYDGRYYDGRYYGDRYYGHGDGPSFSIGPNGVAFGF